MLRVRAIDSHTEGEPTRVVVQGAPDLPGASVAERARALAVGADWFRRAVVTEPRGSEILVGAILVPPDQPQSTAGVIFFNNVGVLGMCGHGTMGVVRTLMHMARLDDGPIVLDTPVGQVSARVTSDGSDPSAGLAGAAPRIAVSNVRSYAAALDVAVRLPGGRTVHGDLAWGGNAFFITDDHRIPIDVAHLPELAAFAQAIKQAAHDAGLGPLEGRPVDHIELVAPPRNPANSARNFVLCPGGAYDRSPCGTGTCAKLACLAERGLLKPGERWRQESVVDTVFSAWCQPSPGGGVLPVVEGRAWITAETELLFDPTDPCRHGIAPHDRGTTDAAR